LGGSDIAAHFGIMALGCVALFVLLRVIAPKANAPMRQVAVGVVLGLLAAILIILPMPGPHGSSMDARAGPAVLAGFIGGPLGAVIAAALGVGARLAVGGPFALSAVVVFCLYCALGVIARRLHARWRAAPGDDLLPGWGLVALLAGLSVAAAACAALFLPTRAMAQFYLAEILPVIAALNVASVLFVGGVLRESLSVLEVNRKLTTLRAELEAALAEAREATAVKTRLLANVSHEFRTPLNAIIGLSTLLRGPVSEEKAARYAKEVESSGRHLLDLVENLLEYSAAEIGPRAQEITRLDTAAVARRAVAAMRVIAEEKGVDIAVIATPGLSACGGAQAMHQCLLNLIGNAVRHTPAGGLVRLVVDPSEDGCVQFCVRDQGPGMPEALQSRLGEPFLRDPDQDDNRRGGLGLAITQSLMQAQGGALRLRNLPEGGAEAVLELPAANPTRDAA
jgi:cell cycle sensor histidine kinase DivJ